LRLLCSRHEDLLTLTGYALQRTPNSEEALLWLSWGLYRLGNINGAVADFNAALEANRFYTDAQYALILFSMIVSVIPETQMFPG